MQYYTYNNLNSQNEYQKVFVDGIYAADREIAIGKELFQIFATFSNETPVGALPLNGYTIYKCHIKLPEFWSQCIKRKENGTIPYVNTLAAWKQQADNNNENCGKFAIIDDETDAEYYGTVRLPCLNTVVLTNNIDLNNSNNVFGSYASGDVGYHNHDNEFKINDTDVVSSPYIMTINDNYQHVKITQYPIGGDSQAMWQPVAWGSTSLPTTYTFTFIYTNVATGNIQCIPANIKVYYWIQVFSSYISQNIQGKLQIIQNILGENGSTLDNYLSLQKGRNS